MVSKIKTLCKARKITIGSLEDRIGLAKNSVYRWDQNKPSVDRVKAVADYFGVTVDELLKE